MSEKCFITLSLLILSLPATATIPHCYYQTPCHCHCPYIAPFALSAVATTGAPVISTQDRAVNKELIAVGREQLKDMAETCRTQGGKEAGALMDAAVAVL
jgi:hypothetical protein